MRLVYKIHDMDCSDEVAILKRELVPVIGDEELLEFDTLQENSVFIYPGNQNSIPPS